MFCETCQVCVLIGGRLCSRLGNTCLIWKHDWSKICEICQVLCTHWGMVAVLKIKNTWLFL